MRVLAFICMIFLAAILPWWLLFITAVVYAFFYDAWELLFIGFALDVFFGQPLPWLPIPILYTAAAALIVIVAEAVKPWFAFYSNESGT